MKPEQYQKLYKICIIILFIIILCYIIGAILGVYFTIVNLSQC